MTNCSYEKIHVECLSGYKANERPVAFTYRNERLEIRDIIDRWYVGGLDARRPAIDYFKVRRRPITGNFSNARSPTSCRRSSSGKKTETCSKKISAGLPH